MSPSLSYLKPLRNSNTFLHIIYKSKKKTNLLCILNNVFQYSKIRTRKRNAKKSIKTEKIWNPALFGIRNPLSWNPESSTRNPESTGWDSESKTVMDSLTWGEIQVAWIGLRTESRRSTSISSKTTPESSWLLNLCQVARRELVFHKLFSSLLTVKSSSDEDE